MNEIKHRDIFLTEDECFVISNFVLNNEEQIKGMGPDYYNGTPDNSLTGRYYLFNYLNVQEINVILKPKLQNLFDKLNLASGIYVQCWANTFRRGDYINSHCHAGEGEDFLSANVFLRGFIEPGTTYHTAAGLVDLKNIDFVFLDGGHSYQTVYNDLTNLYVHMKDKKKVILCDDYGKESYIPEVEKAINDFRKKNNLQLNLIENRFAEIIT